MKKNQLGQVYSRSMAVFIFLIIISSATFSQVNITFQLGVSEMSEKGYFMDDDRVVVRGSFNNWGGTEHELLREANDGSIFRKSFELDLSQNDTIEYKFVIISKEGREFWEEKPDPQNGQYGNRKLLINGDEILAPLATFDYGHQMKGRSLTPTEQLQADFKQMRSILEENHPALYDYTSKAVLDSLFDHYYASIDENTDYQGFYKHGSRIMAHIGCGHTKLFIPGSFWARNPDHFFPLQILINKNEVLVKGYYRDDINIAKGSQLIAIDGMQVEDIIDEMLPYESADGFIFSSKINSIKSRFPEKYAMFYGFPDSYEVEYIAPGEDQIKKANIEPVGFEKFKTIWKGTDELLMKQFKEDAAALITINTFGYYSEVPMFRAFIDSCFLVLKEQNIPNLIIDLRGNDGGDPYCSSYLFSYLEREPVPYFEEAYHHYDTLAKPIVLAENHYTGNVYVLIDGGGFSTTGHLCGLLEYHDLVTFVGTDLGSTYTCTGNTMYPFLDNTELYVGTARERRYTTAVKNMDPMVAVKADHYIEISQDDLVADRDGQLEYTLKLISH